MAVRVLRETTPTGLLRKVAAACLIAVLISVNAVVLVPSVARGQLAQPSAQLVLTYGFLGAIDSLNPFKGVEETSRQLFGAVWDNLMGIGPDMETRSVLATSWTHDASLRNWTYTIRSNVYWSDGYPLTVDDVIFTLEYDTVASGWIWAFFPYVYDISSVEWGPGPDQVTVRFNNPFVPGESLFVPIVPEHIWKNVAPMQASTRDFPAPNFWVGSGAFSMTQDSYNDWLNRRPIRTFANKNYYLGAPAFDVLLWQAFDSADTLTAALQSGTVDVAITDPAHAAGFLSYPGLEVQRTLVVNGYWDGIGINVCPPITCSGPRNPLRYDIEVRKALALVMDKQYILDQIYLGQGEVGYDLIGPVNPFWQWKPSYTGDTPIPYDRDLANQRLDAAGYDVWQGGVRVAGPNSWPVQQGLASEGEPLSFELLYAYGMPTWERMAQYFEQSAGAVGIDLRLRVVDSLTWNSIVYDPNGGNDLYTDYWSGDPDPNFMLFIQSSYSWITGMGWSDNWYSNESYDTAYLEMNKQADPDLRQQYAWEAQKIHYYSYVYLISVFPKGQYVMNTERWTNWGNWTERPGLSVQNYWSATPLWLQVQPAVGYQQVLTSVTVSPDPATVLQGGTQQFVATALDQDGAPIESASIVWGVEPPALGAINGTGYFTAGMTSGLGNVTATATHDGVTLAGMAHVNVLANMPPFDFEVSVPTVYQGIVANFGASAQDPDTTDVLTYTFAWGDGLPDAVVSGTPGATVAAAHTYGSAGSVTLTISVTDGTNPSISDTRQLAVQAPPDSSGSVVGIVRDQSSSARISGAMITATPGSVSALTDAIGVYNLTLQAGTYILTATANGYQTATADPVTVTAGFGVVQDFALVSALGTLDGTVKSSTTGAPIHWASVSVYSGDTLVRIQLTNSSGEFRFSLAAGAYSLSATAVGYVPSGGLPVSVSVGGVTTRIITLSPALSPVADAGPDATAFRSSLVRLNGSASVDANGDPLAYNWTQLAGPATVTLSDPTTSVASFVPTMLGVYVFRLTVTDPSGLSSSDTVSVTVANRSPLADAGPDVLSQLRHQQVTLDGAASMDPDGDALRYGWTQVMGPSVALTGADTDTLSFVPAFPGTYLFELTVEDEYGGNGTDIVSVVVVNRIPVANAGANRTVATGTLVALNGSGSDPDGDSLAYAWTLISGPIVALAGADTARPTFRPKVPGTYTFMLTVSDGFGSSATATVTITVKTPLWASAWAPLLVAIVAAALILALLLLRRRKGLLR